MGRDICNIAICIASKWIKVAKIIDFSLNQVSLEGIRARNLLPATSI